MKVLLTDLEVKLANYVGNARYSANRIGGVVDEKIGPQSNADTDIESAGAEIAFCKANNLYPDLQFDEHLIADAIFYNGMTVDVKQTARPNGRLLVRVTKKDKRCDAYILVTGTMPEYLVVGGYPEEMLFQDSNIIDLGYGPTYAIDQDHLWPVDRLLWRYDYTRAP